MLHRESGLEEVKSQLEFTVNVIVKFRNCVRVEVAVLGCPS